MEEQEELRLQGERIERPNSEKTLERWGTTWLKNGNTKPLGPGGVIESHRKERKHSHMQSYMTLELIKTSQRKTILHVILLMKVSMFLSQFLSLTR